MGEGYRQGEPGLEDILLHQAGLKAFIPFLGKQLILPLEFQ
jgi:hypothetical protein